ncbi:hypothetical protein TSAR_002590 [Trichomalopsis sarcophagae]|uniref:Uncharacterized protein n=1 Tax=Trichomalopsis sarcophagae TaxID=543379 RepID=A0A232F0Y3_9HYME|nr:hypothetical protein TSAR_002590 [Trichomalopsis sarcophagae]
MGEKRYQRSSEIRGEPEQLVPSSKELLQARGLPNTRGDIKLERSSRGKRENHSCGMASLWGNNRGLVSCRCKLLTSLQPPASLHLARWRKRYSNRFTTIGSLLDD